MSCFIWPRSCTNPRRECVFRVSALGGLIHIHRPADYRRDRVGRDVPQAGQRLQGPMPMQDGHPGKRDAAGPPTRFTPPGALLLPRGEGQLFGMIFIWHCTVVSICRGSNRVMRTVFADGAAGTRYTRGNRSVGTIAILSKGKE
jgi:hypothetical protein